MTVRLSPLFHWSPAERHESIRRHGLRAGMPATVAGSPQRHICAGVCPQRAWAISGAMDFVSDIETWDLWLIHIATTDELHVRPDYGPDIDEIMIKTAVPPDRLWWVGRRNIDTTAPVEAL